jgi:hypothetical protein
MDHEALADSALLGRLVECHGQAHLAAIEGPGRVARTLLTIHASANELEGDLHTRELPG